MGFNILLYDLRNHGLSGGKNTTFGYYEKYDLRAIVEWAYMRVGPGGLVGTMGESLGGAISNPACSHRSRLAFVLPSVHLSDLKQMLIYRFKYELSCRFSRFYSLPIL